MKSYHIVPSGHVGIVTLFGKIDDNELKEGFNFPVNLLADYDNVSIQMQNIIMTYDCETSDTQTVNVTTITSLTPNGAMVAENIRNYGVDFIHRLFDPAIQEAVRSQVSTHKITELVTHRQNVQDDITNNLSAWLGKHFITVNRLTVGSVDFSEEYDKAIERKQLEEQKASQRLYELQAKETEAKMDQTIASGKANAAIEEARGAAESIKAAARAEAESLKLRGEAQAEYNERVAKSLTAILIQKEYLQRWDGKVPVNMLSNGNTMFTLPLPTGK
jgi:regulator of protease activity HflC (stomatin/prohibitin superfamily)